MHYEKLEEAEPAHKFTLSLEEAQAVQAAYTELSVRLEQTGNPGSVSQHQKDIILGKAKNNKELIYEDPEQLAEILEEFWEQTDQAALDIAHMALPDHVNLFVIERRRFGEVATALAAEIREVTGSGRPLAEDEETILRQIEEL